jgi:MFS transporter, DHA1 family, multidrug resistance protein
LSDESKLRVLSDIAERTHYRDAEVRFAKLGAPAEHPLNFSPAPTLSARQRDFALSLPFLVLLTCLMGIQPANSDLYLPALPAITAHFSTTTSLVTWTLSAAMAAFGVGQLYVGPLMDRFGRRPFILGGLLAYALANLAAPFAPSIHALIALRMLQGLAVACSFVGSRAMVRDLFEPQEGAKVMARGFSLMAYVPLVGPFIGGLAADRFGWSAPFIVLALLALISLYVAWRYLPETNPAPQPNAHRLGPLLKNYATIFKSANFLAFTFASAASYWGLFTFLSGSAFVFIQVFGMSKAAYGLCFAAVTLGYLMGTSWGRRLIVQRGVLGTMRMGGIISVSAGAVFAALALAGVSHPAAVILPQMIYMVAHGLIQPSGQSGCTASFPTMAGAASALNGALQMAGAVAIGAWMGASYNGTTLPLALTVASCSLMVAMGAIFVLPKHSVLK